MPTKIVHETELPHSPSEVMALLADPALVEARSGDHLDLGAGLVSHRAADGTVVIETRAAIPASWLPGRLAAHADRLPMVLRREEWRQRDQTRAQASLTFTVTGVSGGAASGLSEVAATPTGSRFRQEVTIKVSYPLVGGLVERALAEPIRRSLASEAAYLAAH